MSKIVVVGSINMDVVNRVQKHPLPGETIHGLGTEYSPGGKGANQAVAASLAGGTLTMIGAVGKDPFADELISTLKRFGVHTDSILQKDGTSGMAFITVDASGENNIILSEGSNGKVRKEDINEQLHVLAQADAVLLQNEIPWKTTEYTIERANQLGVRVYFNPAPAMSVPDRLLTLIDVLILNESEAEVVTGLFVSNESEAEIAARQLLDKGANSVIITLGRNGSLYVDRQGMAYHTPAFQVNPVDTTAAGDTFIGALVVAKESGQPMEASLCFASAAAAITVTRNGAQVSIPTNTEIKTFLKDR